jgi:putative transposase
MFDRTAQISVRRKAVVLEVSRGSFCCQPRPVPAGDLKPMHPIDERHEAFPFACGRMLRVLLVEEEFRVGRLRVRMLMKRMGIEALYRKPNTSEPAPGHSICPYLPRKLPVTCPNQALAMDITSISMARSFIHVAEVVDWFTRRVLAWRVSITLEVDLCIEAVEEALARHGAHEIFNSDQGSQFTSTDFIRVRAARETSVRMDGNSATTSLPACPSN